jgi:hypothetical protein
MSTNESIKGAPPPLVYRCAIVIAIGSGKLAGPKTY